MAACNSVRLGSQRIRRVKRGRGASGAESVAERCPCRGLTSAMHTYHVTMLSRSMKHYAARNKEAEGRSCTGTTDWTCDTAMCML